MDDETNLTGEPEEDFDDFDFDEFDDEVGMDPGEQVIESIENNIVHMLDVASVEAVYGAPIKQRDTLIIPAAEVTATMGFGLGVGSGVSDNDEGEPSSGEGGGGGGGGFSLSRPVAVIVSGPEGVRVEPVVDVTKIALAALTAGAFMFGMLARLGNMGRKYKAFERELTR